MFPRVLWPGLKALCCQGAELPGSTGWRGVVYGTLYCRMVGGAACGAPQCWVPRSFLLCWSSLERLLLVPRQDVRGQAASFPSGTRVPRISLQHSVCERSLNHLQGTILDELVNASARAPSYPPGESPSIVEWMRGSSSIQTAATTSRMLLPSG